MTEKTLLGRLNEYVTWLDKTDKDVGERDSSLIEEVANTGERIGHLSAKEHLSELFPELGQQ